MKHKTKFHLINYPAFIMLILLISSCTSHWPQFRGLKNNMIATGNNLPEEWDDSTNIGWTYDLTGVGWSSPVVWGNKIFITSAVAEKNESGLGRGIMPERPPIQPNQANRPGATPPPPPPPPAEDKKYLNDIFRWELTCIDLKTGKEIWKQVAHKGNPRAKTHAGNTYASETPVTDGKRIYVYFGMTGLYCYEMNGNLIWKKDLGAFETLNGWGTGASPVVYDNMVFVQVDNEINSFLVALDAATGEQKWKVEREEKTNYSTPVIWKNKVRTELVTCGKTARSYDPASGKLWWEMKLYGDNSIPSPVTTPDFLYLGNAGGFKATSTLFSVKAGANGDLSLPEGVKNNSGIAWSNTNAGTGNPSPLLYEGLLYILAGRGGELRCYDAASGDSVYTQKISGLAACWASPWANNGKIYFFDERGKTTVIKAGKQFEKVGENKLDDKFWASVAITRDAYIFKGVKKLYCAKK